MKNSGFMNIIGTLCALLSGVCWAFSASLGQYLFEYRSISSYWLVTFRLICAGFCLVIYNCFKKGDIFCVFKNKRDIFDMCIFSVIGCAATQLTYFVAVEKSDAVTATFLSYMAPVFVMLYTLAKERRKPSITEAVSVMLVAVGMFLLLTHGNVHSLQISLSAFIWGVLSAVTFAIYTVQPVNLLKKYSSPIISGWGMLTGGVILFFALRVWQYKGVSDFEGLMIFLLAVIVGTLMAFTFYLIAVKWIGAAKSGMLSSVQPAAAVILGCILFKQKFTQMDIWGFLCIMAMVVLLNKDVCKNNVRK